MKLIKNTPNQETITLDEITYNHLIAVKTNAHIGIVTRANYEFNKNYRVLSLDQRPTVGNKFFDIYGQDLDLHGYLDYLMRQVSVEIFVFNDYREFGQWLVNPV